MVVAGSTDVGVVERQLRRGRARGWLAIKAVLQDRVDRAVGLGADLEAAPAGGLEPGDAVLASEPHDADAGAEALLGMRTAAQDDLDQGGGFGSDIRVRHIRALQGETGIDTRSVVIAQATD